MKPTKPSLNAAIFVAKAIMLLRIGISDRKICHQKHSLLNSSMFQSGEGARRNVGRDLAEILKEKKEEGGLYSGPKAMQLREAVVQFRCNLSHIFPILYP